MRKNRQDALNKLKQAKNGGESRVSQYSISESQDLLIEMPEEEYKKQVAERNKQKFIVDDFGMGYDDEGEFEIAEDDEEELEEEQELEQKNNGSQSIVNFLKPDLLKKQKIAPIIQKEKRENLKANLLNLLDDDNCVMEDILKTNPEPVKKAPTTRTATTLSKNQSEEKLANRYNIPISKLTIASPIKASGPPMDIEAASENRKRREPGVEPEVIKEEEEPIFYEPLMSPQKDSEMLIPTKIEKSPEPVNENFEAMEIDQNTIETLSLEDNHDLPLDEGNSLYVYWIDAIEDKDLVFGSVYIFGKIYLPKIKQFTGICIIVQEVTRSFYALPKKEFQDRLSEVDEELETYRRRYGIRKWEKSQVTRRYAFEIADVPQEAEYIKVRYSSKFPPIQVSSCRTISHIFGAKTSLVETLLVKRKLKGPCWIKINNVLPCKNKNSNCKIEVVIPSHKNIEFGIEESNKIPPPLVMMSLAMKTLINKKGEAEIFSIAGTIHNCIDQTSSTADIKGNMCYFSLINTGKPYKRLGIIESFSNERELLNNFLEKILKLDPDIIAGHDLLGDLLEKLIHRLNSGNVKGWSSLGRILRHKFPHNRKEENYAGNWQNRALTAGRLLLDTELSSKELIKETTYALPALVKKLFNIDRNDIEFDASEAVEDEKKIIFVADHTKQDSSFVHQIVNYLNVIPLTKQLTNIAGNLWMRSLQNQRAERNEMLLVHEFYKYKYIIPDKAEKKFEAKSEKKKNQYSGGLVLSPVAGLYDKFVILLDFNSLYPSIIREYNICFTTVLKPPESKDEIDNRPGSVIEDASPGILPEIIKDLVTRRRATKAAMKTEKNPLKLKQLDIKQQALKLTANSLYGCLGFKQSRFYARAIAALITQLGRNTLENTVKIATEKLNLEVIYGDTDSIMINTNLSIAKEAVMKGDELKKIVNKQFKHLEIELDGVFQSMLLLKKKKYAAIKIENGVTKREVKGLDMVRRDWCGWSKKVSSNILDLILSNYTKEEIAENIKGYIEEFMKNYDSSTLGDFIIFKQLTKAIDKYKDAQNQPHVQVAIRLMKKGETNIQKHFIPYIICEGEESNIASRAYHPDEVNSSIGVLKPDKRWYINQQIIPPIQRLIAPIDIIKIEEIVELLGEDPNKYRSVYKEAENNYQGQPIMAKCPEKDHVLYDITTSSNSYNCPQCKTSTTVGKYVQNAINSFIKQKMLSTYTTNYQCSDFNCRNISKSRFLKKCNRFNCNGKMLPIHTLIELHKDLQNIKELGEKPSAKESFAKSRKILDKSHYMKIELKNLSAKDKPDYHNLF